MQLIYYNINTNNEYWWVFVLTYTNNKVFSAVPKYNKQSIYRFRDKYIKLQSKGIYNLWWQIWGW